jgi:hypothetical protein
LKPPGKLLKPRCDGPLSIISSKFNLRRYTKGVVNGRVAAGGPGRGIGGSGSGSSGGSVTPVGAAAAAWAAEWGIGVQVAIAAAFAPVQAAWFLIGIPCDALAYLVGWCNFKL